jgi:hypothetical protein
MWILALLVILLVGPAAQAEDAPLPPRCGPELDGQVICRFNTVYECQHVSPQSLERHTGWRWVADLLQACDRPLSAEASQGAPQQLPPGFTYAPQVGESTPQQQGAQSSGVVPPTGGSTGSRGRGSRY